MDPTASASDQPPAQTRTMPADRLGDPATVSHDPADTADAGAPDLPGYTVERELGRGGMGVVYLARDQHLGRTVAVKVMLAGAFATPSARDRFLTEAAAMARLAHPHIVPVLHFGQHAGLPYLVMEHVGGGTLADRFRAGPVPATDLASLLEPVARAVGYFHAHGLVHRDLKPENVLLTTDGTPKVADFGLAKEVGANGRTGTQAVVGTPRYMAPEVAAGGGRDATPATDVWAVGVMLYEGLSGVRPFVGDNTWAVLEAVRTADPPPLSKGTPTGLAAVCLKCLAKVPAQRYPDAAALAADLARWRAGEPVSVRPPTWGARVYRRARRLARFWPAGLACGAAVAVGLREWQRPAATMVTLAPTPATLDTPTAVDRSMAQWQALPPEKREQILRDVEDNNRRRQAEQAEQLAKQRQASVHKSQQDREPGGLWAINRSAPLAEVRQLLEQVITRDGPTCPAALVLEGLISSRRGDHAAALRTLRTAIQAAAGDPKRYHSELFMAYRYAGPAAIAHAHTDEGTPTRGRLIAEAIEWGEALDKLDSTRADGAIIAGCACEDRGWLDRMPLDVRERCGSVGPYQTADEWFQKASKLDYGVPDAAASNRGRNLFKWVEDESQLGRYTADDTAKSLPNKQRLDNAVVALGNAERGSGPLSHEARYWLAEATLLRYQAAARFGAENRLALQKEAIAAVERVLPRPGEVAEVAKWQMGAERLVGIHTADADRLEKSGELPAAAAAAARAAEAAAAQALPKARQAELLVRQAGLSMAQAGEDLAKQAIHFPIARLPLQKALKTDPDNPARWEWRSELGKVEMAAARQYKGTDKQRATGRYSVACNNMRVAQVVGNLQQSKTPDIAAAYKQLLDRIGPLYGEIDKHFKKEYPDGLPVDRFGAAVRLVWIDLDYEADKRVAGEKRSQVMRMLDMLRGDKGGLDDDLREAGEAAADRVLNRR